VPETMRKLPQRALDTCKTLSKYMGIYLSRPHIGMTQQGLHCSNIAPTAQQLGGERMAERMATSRLVNPGVAHSQLNCALNGADMHMMPYALPFIIKANGAGREKPLPLQ